MRTLSSNAQALALQNTGTSIRRLLQIDFPVVDPTTSAITSYNTTWYSTESFLFSPGTGDVSTVAIVKNWGTMMTQADPNKMGGNSQLTIEIFDPDHSLKTLFDTFPGIQTARCKVWLWFDRTNLNLVPWTEADWSDAVCIFGGTISNPVTWMESTGTYRCTLKGYELLFDKNLSVTLTRDRFNDVQCTDCEGVQMPLVYGSPCIRVPCCPISRPGHAVLAQTLGIHDTVLYINLSASAAKFTYGETITLIVGSSGGWEAITGSFANGSTNVFNISSRGAIEASGVSPGVYSSDGHSYFLINRADVSNPDNTRNGQPIWTKHSGDTTWREWDIEYWFQSGDQQATVIEPADYSFATGDNWKIGRVPGVIPLYQAGSAVNQKAPWVFAANFAPSHAVVRVEAKSTVQDPVRGGTRNVYFSYSNDASVYTVNLNDTSFNASLGRPSGAAGITTITLNQPPSYFNFDDHHLYVSLDGCTMAGTAGSWTFDNPSYSAITNPVDIIGHMLCSPIMGGIDQTKFINVAAFQNAWNNANAIPLQMAFAITSVKRLHQTASEVAFQGMMLYFWDGGKAVLQTVKVYPQAADAIFTVDSSKYRAKSFQTDQYDVREMTTELASTFALSQSSPQVTLTRSVPSAIEVYGLRQDTIDLYAYQYPSLVALVTEFWLAYRLNRQRSAKFDLFLHGTKLQPGDTILLNPSDGNGVSFFESQPARIYSISHQSSDALRKVPERLTVVAEYCLWPWTVTAITPPLRDCNAWFGTATGPVSTTLTLGALSNSENGGAPKTVGMPDPLGQAFAMVPPQMLSPVGSASSAQWLWGKLVTNLAAPTGDGFGHPTYATVNEWIPDPSSGADPKPLIETSDSTMLGLTVENYARSISGKAGQACAFSLNPDTDRYEIRWVRAQSALHEGVATSAITTAVTNGWTGAATITATEYIDNPSDSSTPRQFVSDSAVSVVVRDKLLIAIGDYIQWQDIYLSDGSIEHELTWVRQKSSSWHQGVATSPVTTAITNSWTGATTITATEYVDDPTDTSSPRHFIIGSTGVDVVVRDKITFPTGSYIEWQTITLSDGTTENELTWVRPPAVTLHQGVVTTGLSAPISDSWSGAAFITVTEYIPDPSDSSSPRSFIAGASYISVAVREKITIRNGSFVEWQSITLPDGTTENELTWVKPPTVTLHQGISSSAVTSPVTDGWASPNICRATEYIDDPTDTGSPRRFIAGTTGITVVVREKVVFPSGSYIGWQTITLADGTQENELTWVRQNAGGVRYGQVTAGIDSPSGNHWTSAQTITVDEYIPDPSSTTSPRGFIAGTTGLTVVVREQRTIRVGQFVEFQTIVLADGTTENELTFCKDVSFHQGQVTRALSAAVTDPWGGAGTITVTEYTDDPTSTTEPRAFLGTTSRVTVVVRSKISAIPTGTYVQWCDFELTDGTIENTLTGADC